MAAPNPKQIDTNGLDQEDQEYNPSAEALIDDIDDERTLDEEEALEGISADDEVDDLRKDAEMPLDELLAYYSNLSSAETLQTSSSNLPQQGTSINTDQSLYVTNSAQNQSTNQNDPSRITQELMTDNISPESTCKQNYQDDLPQCSSLPPDSCLTLRSDENKDISTVDSCVHETEKPSSTNYPSSMSLQEDSLNPLLAYELDDSDDDEDYSYSDEDVDMSHDWRRAIQVGPQHQATIPDGLSHYDDAPAYENEDRLMWCCKDMTMEQIQDFLIKAAALSKKCSNILKTMPTTGDHLRRYQQQDYCPKDPPTISNSSSGEEPMQIDDLYMEQSRKQQRANQHDLYLQQQANVQKDINENDDHFNSQHVSPLVPGETQVSSLITSQVGTTVGSGYDTRPKRRETLTKQHHIQDEEQLLYLLLQCNHNVEEALRRRRIDPYKYYTYEPMSSWSQDECSGFESGLKSYGKDFRSINQNKVQTRSHGELVAFYYIWKKSERHDIYINQYKIDRKRCFAHPGTTDYMDKFIEENEAILASPQVSAMDICDSQSAQTDATSVAHRTGAMMTSHNFPIFQQNNDNSANIVSSISTCTNPTI